MNLGAIALTFSLLAFIVALLAVFYVFRSRPSIVWRKPFSLRRHDNNPVISPLEYREWEICGTFNPAAFEDDDGQVHLLYRAIGGDGLSRVGYATSSDGMSFNDRCSYPVFQPTAGNGLPDANKVNGPMEYNPSFYTSGGGWGGCEDPRTVRIGDKIYMIYVAFEGWSSVRIGLTSIGVDEVKKGRWNWRRPLLISPPNQVNKNWVLFPEKINGKFAILHGISPQIRIDYVDNFEYLHNSDRIKSAPPKGGRPAYWDNWVRGAGPPPLRTELGWLLLYHAMDQKDPNKYKLGAMILDMNEPTRILYRSPTPILEPERHYENDGKPGVVYASGALIRDNNLLVYYGGGDRHVCVAETSLPHLLDWLKTYGRQ